MRRHSNYCNWQWWPQQGTKSIEKGSQGMATSWVVMTTKVITPQSWAKRVKPNTEDVAWLWLKDEKKEGVRNMQAVQNILIKDTHSSH